MKTVTVKFVIDNNDDEARRLLDRISENIITENGSSFIHSSVEFSTKDEIKSFLYWASSFDKSKVQKTKENKNG
jgi:hypothetical protein